MIFHTFLLTVLPTEDRHILRSGIAKPPYLGVIPSRYKTPQT